MTVLHLALLLSTFLWSAESAKRPHIVFMLADDLGWSDVSFHGSRQIPTVNIDAIARDGIILNHYYTQAVCSPSRGALMTGKYPIRLGFQSAVIHSNTPWGLPLNETLLPEYFKSLGYVTHGIGKWHLGFFKDGYLPQNRGFDTYFGYWTGAEDYYTHFANQDDMSGLDLHFNCWNQWQYNGTYGTELYTSRAQKIIREHDQRKPLFLYLAQQSPHSGDLNVEAIQCPEKYIKPLKDIHPGGRHRFAGMVSALDFSVGDVFAALDESGMLDDTIFIFSSDNGGAVSPLDDTFGSNYPFRGTKHVLWEGGSRAVGFVWSSRLRLHSRIYSGLMHITDWLPTLLSAAGGSEALKMLKNDTIDGLDQWPSISQGLDSPRREVLLNIDNVANVAAIRRENFKLVNGTYFHGEYDGYYNQEGLTMKSHSDVFTAEQLITYDKNYYRYLSHSKAADVLWRNYGRDPSLAASCLTPECEEQLQINCGLRPEKETCNALVEACLFDIGKDPCELYNVAKKFPEVVKQLHEDMVKYIPFIVPSDADGIDPKSNPALHGDAWVPWESPCCTVRGVCVVNVTDEEK